ncbi:adenylate/guanylate cyclase domain-containing protein [Bradyrhizobium sp. CB1717]|uniref:adenylate/guanylate cyclase domain-containing protein n=1 Tax=Bradyrhizobium sp. CB1717 TaxID=3039154 RepID=UPI0024B18321|nr:adenylate/guanylate cyclase domain-containing protein [Bradyrhizobium sp. CB1717]WFU25538.1 adenylate/guanylate cyclase domain-containing protein [Bradyrhizobium sp. CB1717]
MAKLIETKRRLAAIFAADVEGYSRLMGTDEVATLSALTALLEILDGLIATHGGRVANTAGDSVLAEFGSAVDAVRCAMEAQEALAKANGPVPERRRVNFRIGVHVGDIMFRAGDLFGTGVNIAARLQALAKAGGVCISGVTYDQVRNILPLEFTDLGAQSVKNLEEPIRVYEVKMQLESASSTPKDMLNQRRALVLPDRPSIAVLPFENMSADPEQDYFADGMVEDIITELSRFKSLFVIARNSSFTYKGMAVDIKRVGRELGVRYVLEGSVRRSGGRVRITGQLIDSATGVHLWADRFDGSKEDVFDLQDRVTASVVGQIFSRVQLDEEERANRKPTTDLEAYDYYLRGMSRVWKWNKDDSERALALFSKAVELDDNFALAHAMLSNVYTFRKQIRVMDDPDQETKRAVHHAQRCLELGREDGVTLVLGGFSLAYMANEVKFGADCIARGLSLNPNLAWGWLCSGWVNSFLGAPQTALEHLAQAERLSPRDPSLPQIKLACALAHFVAGRYEDAIRLTEELPNLLGAWRIKAVSYAMSGDLYRAADAGKKVLQLDPTARASVLAQWLPLQRPEDRERYRKGLLAAGIPDLALMRG